MNTFITACRKEWARLGVPEAAANEMAADLEADLAEAEADGVSPEHVLGNGYFDPASFAASWATAAGITDEAPVSTADGHRRRWVYVVGALTSFAVGLLGLVLLVGIRHGAVGISKRALFGPGFQISPIPRVPAQFMKPSNVFAVESSHAFVGVGLVLLVAALVGIGTVLWLWKPWAPNRRGPGPDPDIGMPSYL
jgi:hypothetical protein